MLSLSDPFSALKLGQKLSNLLKRTFVKIKGKIIGSTIMLLCSTHLSLETDRVVLYNPRVGDSRTNKPRQRAFVNIYGKAEY